MSGKVLFFVKVAIAIVIFIALMGFASWTIETTTERFGNWGWIHWIIGLLTTAGSLLALWACAITWWDCRNLERYRANPTDRFEDGQSVALSGQLRFDGEPLQSPFGGTPCAAYSYLIKGQRRTTGSSGGSSTRSELCAVGFGLASVVFETEGAALRLLAIPDVDADLRENVHGDDWGERASERVAAMSESSQRSNEPTAQGRLTDAQRHSDPPLALDLFVANYTGDGSNVTVVEDCVPVDEPITLLGTWVAPGPGSDVAGLDGRRLGGMKAFKGHIDERLAELSKQLRLGLKYGTPALIAGAALMTLASWWP